MKKTKVICIVLVVAIILMGAGYAYWQQDLNIKTTVDTGDLSVTFLPMMLEDLVDGIDHGGYDNKLLSNTDYVNVDLNIDAEKITCEFEDLYPGSGGYIRFRIANTGTVPARVTDITSVLKSGTTKEILDKFDYKIQTLSLYTPDRAYGIIRWDSFFGIPYPVFGHYDRLDVDLEGLPIIATTFDEFVEALETRLSAHVLEPYSYFVINGEGTGYDIILPSNIDDSDGMEGLTDLGFDLEIEFTQGE